LNHELPPTNYIKKGQQRNNSLVLFELNTEFEVVIQSLVYGGSGMGRLVDGRAVFIPFTLPGEKVKARVREEKKGFVMAEVLEILKPSSQRIKPRCIHYGICGGCHYQQIPYDLQVAYKKEIFVEQLQRIGNIENPLISQVVESKDAWNYRNSMQFHLTPSGKLGFERRTIHEPFEIQECYLPCNALNETWHHLDFEFIPEIERVELRQGDDEEILLTLYSQNPTPPEFETELPISAVHTSPQGQIILAGNDHLFIKIHEKSLRVNAGSFFQANHFIAEKMVSILLEKIHPTKDMVILDAYCGVGLFSIFLAPFVDRCLGVEISPSACQDYAFNLDAFDNVELYEGTTEEVLPLLETKPNLVVLDPPRSGVERRALAALVKMAPEQLVYVSCNPATLARDAKLLIGAGYKVEESILLDMFPQTFHIESLIIFNK
jgi:23S rRNA (uracil1939-C5)-methyltransferase